MSELEERWQARANAQPIVVRCAACPDWSFTGSALEARERFRDHRADAHPQAGRAGDRPKPSGVGIGMWPKAKAGAAVSAGA